jgi:REP element-mobilizing transposase RayT
MTYNPDKHHRRSIRLKGYDYSQAGMYFITICCQDRICRFGQIVKTGDDGRPEMILNEYGHIAFNEWLKTTEIRNNIELGEFVIMPNHIHGIIRITCRGESHSPIENNVLHSPKGECNTNRGECNTPLRSPSQTIGAIVRGYKSSVTKQLGLLGFDGKLWQRNYHEYIIRNENSYLKISEYIKNNPLNWDIDKLK